MQVTVKQIAGPQSYNWEDIAGATAAQSVAYPDNIVLKVTNGVALRLTTCAAGAKGTTQNPGTHSRWYKCQIAIDITPVIGVNSIG